MTVAEIRCSNVVHRVGMPGMYQILDTYLKLLAQNLYTALFDFSENSSSNIKNELI